MIIIYLIGVIVSFSLIITLQRKEKLPDMWCYNDYENFGAIVLIILGPFLWFLTFPIMILTYIFHKIIK